MNKILPKEIKNIFYGHPISYWGFIIFLTIMTWRSIIHMFYQEYGLHEIANFIFLTGDPDPMPVIYLFFSLWGLSQLIFCSFCWIIIFKYKELIPLMYVLFILEFIFRVFLYPIIGLNLASNQSYSDGLTPGADFAPVLLLMLIILLFLSLRESKKNNP